MLFSFKVIIRIVKKVKGFSCIVQFTIGESYDMTIYHNFVCIVIVSELRISNRENCWAFLKDVILFAWVVNAIYIHV